MTKKINEEETKPEVIEQCFCLDPNCNSMKQQILYYNTSQDRTVLTILCLECGKVSGLLINGGIPMETIPQPTTKRSSYLG